MKSLGPLFWLTDYVEPPSKESVGLTASWTTCDRLAFRYIVQTQAAIHWFDIRQRAPKDVVTDLEEFGQPEHWFLVRRPVLPSEFTFDATYTHVKNGETNNEVSLSQDTVGETAPHLARPPIRFPG